MIRLAIVEDTEEYRETLRGYVERFGQEEQVELSVTTFPDGSGLLKNYTASYDMILLDIEMPGKNGMEIAEEIRRTDEKTVLMFITNMAQYAIRGYAVGALDFLMKPVNYITFHMKFRRGIERVLERREEELILQTRDGLEKLLVRSIYYVEVQNRMLHYHTDRGELLVRGTMQSAEERLAPYHFAKCNHWYLVNLRHVQRIRHDTVVVAGQELEISRRTKTAFLNALTDYMGGNI